MGDCQDMERMAKPNTTRYKWLRAIGTGRSACIGLGCGTNSETFPLGKGHAQGDSPSPLLYNLAAQIVIFKIELNPGIVRIP